MIYKDIVVKIPLGCTSIKEILLKSFGVKASDIFLTSDIETADFDRKIVCIENKITGHFNRILNINVKIIAVEPRNFTQKLSNLANSDILMEGESSKNPYEVLLYRPFKVPKIAYLNSKAPLQAAEADRNVNAALRSPLFRVLRCPLFVGFRVTH